MSEQRNIILALVLSVGILLAFQFLYEAPRIEEAQRQQATEQAKRAAQPSGEAGAPAAPAVGGTPPPVPGAEVTPLGSRAVTVESGRRLAIRSPRVSGSVLLDGGRIDDLTLHDYHETIDPNSPEIVLLSPTAAPKPYYVEFGWVPAKGVDAKVPDSTTPWRVEGDALTPTTPVRLVWDNGQGLRFERTIALDANYMFTVSQRVENTGSEPVSLYPYALISRRDTPETTGFYILHEGALGVFDETLKEIDYDEIAESKRIEATSTGGWLGITDKYWLVALVPDQTEPFTGSFNHSMVDDRDRYQVDYLLGPRVVPAGGSIEVGNRLFAGAKEVTLLDAYNERLGIDRFDLAIDWGWFYFLTRPIFTALDYLNQILGNFGLAILVLTVLIKILFFPLANKSYVAMGRMKKLQPEVTKMRERYAGDRQRLNQAMMELYKREKVNPMSGCLPIVIQIPVFFALYKVLFVTIEMRHAPFYGWIRDLSAPDPTTIVNLFGLIPWTPPEAIPALGIWPIVMGISMYLQQRLNPQPPDPIQAKIFLFMPLFFTVLLASFPAGLVIYWTWNNVLSILQQWIIMRRAGART